MANSWDNRILKTHSGSKLNQLFDSIEMHYRELEKAKRRIKLLKTAGFSFSQAERQGPDNTKVKYYVNDDVQSAHDELDLMQKAYNDRIDQLKLFAKN